MKANERLSELFSFEIELLHEETKEDYKPTIVKDTDIIGKSVTIAVTQDDGGKRTFSGIVNRFAQGNRTSRYSFYHATVVPHVWVLTQKVQSRIFQQMSVPQILEKIFEGFQTSPEMQGDFKPRNYCVQYRESDFDFASRLMEEEGIFYYFEHDGGMDKLILGNDPGSHKDCPVKSEIAIFDERGGAAGWTSTIRDWRYEQRLQSGKVTNWDHHFQLPTKKLDEMKQSRFNAGGNQELEIYNYPGGYARKYDGIDSGGGESPSDLQNVFPDMRNTVKYQMEALDAHYKISEAISDCCTLTAGHKFTLTKHPNSAFNGQYVLLSVLHEINQTPDYPGTGEMERPEITEFSFTCIPHGSGAPVYRPLAKTPKPFIYSTQTATVVGASGEEITTDKYGRVKIQFHWDREGEMNTGSSCWARVAQAWAGNKWGAMFIPRIGMEVVVHFLEGNPDLPIITGCVYNPGTMPPYILPDEKTKSTIKSNSTVGGGGFNEFRFEDKKGKEQIFIHGEKDLDVRIKNDAKAIIKNDKHVIVENDHFEKVKGDQHLIVTGDQKEKVGGGVSLTVGGDLQIKTGPKTAIDASQEIHLKAGMKIIIEAGTQVSLKAGASFIDLGPSGVTISGPMVNINSGGSAGSGGGSSPDAPTEPKEADTADPGDAITLPPNPPPLAPSGYSSPAANAMSAAAESGAPFVGG